MLALPRAAAAQPDFVDWLNNRIAARVDARDHAIAEDAVGQNGKSADKQRESPAGDTRSTSLVDQTAATDFVAAAVNLATAASNGTSPPSGSGSQTVTASLYGLLAGFNARSPSDPAFYAAHVNARRMSFTVGTVASDAKTDGTDTLGTVVGAKFLAINGRDLYTKANRAAIAKVQEALTTLANAQAMLVTPIQEILFRAAHPDAVSADGTIQRARFVEFITAINSRDRFPAILDTIGPDVLRTIDARIDREIGTFAGFRQQVQQAYDQIQGGAQLALVYTATLRRADGFDQHRGEIAYDYGLSPRLTWTANGSVDVLDRKAAGSSIGGRVATEFVGDLTGPGSAWGKTPIRLSFSGEVKWADGESTAKALQAKLTIPIASGFELPIVYRYGNPSTQATAGSEGRVGLAVDLSRLAHGLQ